MATNNDDTLPPFWPTVRAAVRAPGYRAVSCQICLGDLAIAGVTFPGLAHPSVYDPATHHAAVVLPCGHIFGAACLQTFAAYDPPAPGHWRPRHCPACREFLTLGCGHPVAGRRLPLFVGECGTCLAGQSPSENTMDEHCDRCTMTRMREHVAPLQRQCAARPGRALPPRVQVWLTSIVIQFSSFRDIMAKRARGQIDDDDDLSESDDEGESSRDRAIDATLARLHTTTDVVRYLTGETQHVAELEAKLAAPAQHDPATLRFLMGWKSPASDAVVDRRMHCICE